MPDSAYDTFQKTIKRSYGLLNIYEKAHNNDDFTGQNITDLIRASVVLAVSGMDAYFTSRFSESLVSFLKDNGPTKDLIDILYKAGLDTEQALEMLTMKRPYRRVRTLVDEHLSKHVTQRFNVIDDLFKVYGIQNLSDNAQGLSGRKTLKRRVEKTVKRRHSIAHNGDYNSHHRLRDIKSGTIKKQIKDVELFVNKCEALISKVLG